MYEVQEHVGVVHTSSMFLAMNVVLEKSWLPRLAQMRNCQNLLSLNVSIRKKIKEHILLFPKSEGLLSKKIATSTQEINHRVFTLD